MNHDKANTVLVLGILGVTMCAVCAPIAWFMGNSYLASCRAAGVQPQSAGTTGRILGIVGTGLLGLGLVIAMAVIVIQVLLLLVANA